MRLCHFHNRRTNLERSPKETAARKRSVFFSFLFINKKNGRGRDTVAEICAPNPCLDVGVCAGALHAILKRKIGDSKQF